METVSVTDSQGVQRLRIQLQQAWAVLSNLYISSIDCARPHIEAAQNNLTAADAALYDVLTVLHKEGQ